MKKSIAVLEDNDDRQAAMRAWLDDRLRQYDLFLTDDPDEFIQYVRDRSGDILAVSLDHDLHERADHSTTLTGMLVVDHLVNLTPAFPVLLHTTNSIDGERMRARLVRRGWDVEWVVPFDGTTWVGATWYPALKRAIRKTARREPVPAGDDVD